MMREMQAQQGSTIHLDAASQRAALSRVRATMEVHEQPLDQRTAHLVLDLWAALFQRATIVREVGALTGTFDGASYHAWYSGKVVRTYAPPRGSVLENATSGIARLGRIAEGASDAQEELDLAIVEMKNALHRTLRKEACLRPYIGR